MENRLADHAVIWDEKHVKSLLGLRRHFAHMVQVEPWRSWVQQRGGLTHVRQTLRSSPLLPDQRKLLGLILDYPDSSATFYANQLNISPSSYFVHLNHLLQTLLLELNNWQMAAPVILHTNLPAPLTPLIGADKNIASVTAILKRPGLRLLTLTGPGGVGKTRLAIAVGTRLLNKFSDGVFFISLETLSDPALLITQIARSLSVEAIGGQPLLDVLKFYLRERQILLILDNFEQLIKGGPLVVDLLQASPHLKVLVTSREVLNLYGENQFTVPELTLPDPDHLPPLEQLNRWPAVALFVQRVQARHPAFALTENNQKTIARICQRLDGLPLAIELAAAQVRFLSPDQTLPQLEHGLKSLKDPSNDRPSRQKTLWDAIDWSYQLLSAPEKAIFRRLSVFGREWSLTAAQSVCQMDDLAASLEELVDKNLLRYAGQGEAGDSRFQMLQPVREYAFDQLDSNAEAEQTQRRHASYFVEMTQQAEPAIGTPEQLYWVRCIKQERENLQIALQWMLDRQETEMAFTLLGAVWRYYNMLNLWDETKSWLDRALAQGEHLKTSGRVKALWGATWLATHYNDTTRQMSLAEDGLTLARKIGDRLLIGLMLQSLGDGLRRRRQYDQAIALFEESLVLFREMDNKEEIAWVLYHIANTIFDRGERARSMEIRYESLAIFRAIGDHWSAAAILRLVGLLALEDGDYQLAAQAETERLGIYRVVGARHLTSETLFRLARLLWHQGDFEQIKPIIDENLALAREIGDRAGIAGALQFKGRLALQFLDLAAARSFFEQARVIFSEIDDVVALRENQVEMGRLALLEKSIKRGTAS